MGREAHPEDGRDREAHPEVWKGSGGPPKGREGVGSPKRWSGTGLEAHPEVREG